MTNGSILSWFLSFFFGACVPLVVLRHLCISMLFPGNMWGMLMYPWYIYKGYQSFSCRLVFPNSLRRGHPPAGTVSACLSRHVSSLYEPMFATSSGGQACTFMGCIFKLAMQSIAVCVCMVAWSVFLPWGVALIFILLLLFIHFLDFPFRELLWFNLLKHKKQLELYRSMHITGAKFPFSLPHIQLWMPHVAWQKVRFRDKQQGTNTFCRHLFKELATF